MRMLIKNFVYEFRYLIEKIKGKKIYRDLKNIHILSDEKTIDLIIREKKSIARFGDGEFKWILKEDDSPEFQINSDKLSKRLIDVLTNMKSNILISIPINIKDYKNRTVVSKWFWQKFINSHWEKIKKYISYERIYGNTNFTRFYMDYKNKEYTYTKIKNIRKIWNDRDIVIVEGEKTKIGIGNDLLNNAKSIKRIICPSKNAFESYDEIFKSINNNVNNKDLILIALGPTATILAYDLSFLGFQAIDIGHVDIEYEWWLKNAKEKIQIKGKAVNEAKKSYDIEENVDNLQYKNSIIDVIKEKK